MPANIDPIFSRAPDVQLGGAVLGPTANTAMDGSGAVAAIFQADTINGGFVEGVRLSPVGSPAATVARLYLCSVTGAFTAGTTNTASNTSLIGEVTLGAITASQTVAQMPAYIPVGFAIPPGWRLLLSFGTSTGAAGTGYSVTAIGGKF